MTINPISTANTATVTNSTNIAANAVGNANASSTTDAATIDSAVTTRNTSNDIIQTSTSPKSETVQGGQQPDATQVQQSGTSKDVASSKAFSVALEGVITTEISELARTVASRAALVKSLPPEIRELVQQVLNQTQAAQTTLTEGLVTLLKSPKTVSENLTTLVDIMETAAGLSTRVGAQEQLTARTGTSKQLPVETATVWQGVTPDDLTSTAKGLRELAAILQSNDKMPKQQEAAANMPRANPTGNTQTELPLPTTILQSATQAAQEPAATTQSVMTKGQADLMSASKSANQTTDAKQSEMAQSQQGLLARTQNTPAKPVMSGNNLVTQQPAQLLSQAELLKSLPPEIREFVLTMFKQDETSMPATQTTRNLQQTAQTLPSIPSTSANPATQVPVATKATATTATTATVQAPLASETTTISQRSPSSTQQMAMPLSQAATAAQVLQTGQQVQQVAAALAEQMTALNKSRKSPVEKITELASFVEQAAATITSQQPKDAQSAALRQQALVEMAEILQKNTPEELKAAIKVVQELADTLAKPSGVTAERQEGQKVLTLAIPLYFGEGQTVYPAYIHVYYQEQEDKKNPGQKVSETWLRVCLETENIGMVDAAFRLYDENNLDVKVRFTEEEAAIGFTRGIDEVKEQLRQLPLTLGDILVK